MKTRREGIVHLLGYSMMVPLYFLAKGVHVEPTIYIYHRIER